MACERIVMLKRIITALCATCVLVPALIFSGTWVFPIAISLVTLICLFEMYKCMGIHKNIAVTLPAYLIAAALPILVRFMGAGNGMRVVAVAAIAAVVYIIYLFALVIWSNGSFTYSDMATLFFLTLYVTLSLNILLYVRDFAETGKYIYLLIFIGAWITDIFAYFTGVFFGKHKLIEAVSPKKTIEGSIGGIFFCTLSFVVFGIITEKFFGCDANLVFLALSGLFISVIAQIGDLIMSVLKRHYKIKDFGKIFPGHGGMLDRFDSILAVSLGVGVMCLLSYVTGISML